MMIVKKNGSFREFLAAFSEKLKPYASHRFIMFIAAWQNEQCIECINNIGIDEAVIMMDFAEHYSCRMRRETHGKYYSYSV